MPRKNKKNTPNPQPPAIIITKPSSPRPPPTPKPKKPKPNPNTAPFPRIPASLRRLNGQPLDPFSSPSSCADEHHPILRRTGDGRLFEYSARYQPCACPAGERCTGDDLGDVLWGLKHEHVPRGREVGARREGAVVVEQRRGCGGWGEPRVRRMQGFVLERRGSVEGVLGHVDEEEEEEEEQEEEEAEEHAGTEDAESVSMTFEFTSSQRDLEFAAGLGPEELERFWEEAARMRVSVAELAARRAARQARG